MRPFLVGVVSLCLGCATTSITSISDRAAQPAGFKTIFVWATYDDLDFQRKAEVGFTGVLAVHGVAFWRATDIMFSLRGKSREEIGAALLSRGVDGVVIISPHAAGTTTTWVPMPTYSTTNVTPNAYGGGATATTTTTGGGGINASSAWANTRATLYDLASGETVWEGQLKTSGWEAGQIPMSVGKKLASALLSERFIVSRRRP